MKKGVSKYLGLETENYKEVLLNRNLKCCLSAFGSGLTWAAIIMDIGNLDFCELFISNC